MARSLVRLPPEVRSPFDVYVNGVRQEPGRDYRVEAGALVFDRELRKDKISSGAGSSVRGAWGPTARTTQSTSATTGPTVCHEWLTHSTSSSTEPGPGAPTGG